MLLTYIAFLYVYVKTIIKLNANILKVESDINKVQGRMAWNDCREESEEGKLCNYISIKNVF